MLRQSLIASEFVFVFFHFLLTFVFLLSRRTRQVRRARNARLLGDSAITRFISIAYPSGFEKDPTALSTIKNGSFSSLETEGGSIVHDLCLLAYYEPYRMKKKVKKKKKKNSHPPCPTKMNQVIVTDRHALAQGTKKEKKKSNESVSFHLNRVVSCSASNLSECSTR